MFGLQLGRTSTLQGSAARTSIVLLASQQDPENSGIRRLTRSAALPITSRIKELRSLIPGLTSLAAPTPNCEQPSSTATSRGATSSVLHPGHPAVLASNPAQTTSISIPPTITDSSNASPQRLHNDLRHPVASTSSPGASSRSHLHLNAHQQFTRSTHQSKRLRHSYHHLQPYSELHLQDSTRQPSPHSAAAAPQRHPTLRLISSRLLAGSKPGARNDGARLGLVVEGGGMRGCISGAMLMALHELGVSEVFDVVYGASAGAINATYFLSGQRYGLRIYSEDLTQGTAFLNFRNIFSGSSRPVMNIDYLIDQVVASCLDSLQPVLLDGFADRNELAEALKATAAVPQIAGLPRRMRGRTLVDAAVFEPVPVQSAIRDGCSHMLVLCTRPAPTGRSPWAHRVRSTIEVLAKTTVLNAPYMRDAWRAARSEPSCCPAWQDEQLLAALLSCPHEFRDTSGAFVLPLYPEHTAGCHPLCLDPDKLMAACEVGHTAMMRLLGPVVAAAGGQDVLEAADVVKLSYPLLKSETQGVSEGGNDSGRGTFGGAELYSGDADLRFRP